MKKLNCYICDHCRKVLWYVGSEPEAAKTVKEHYCDETCLVMQDCEIKK